MWKAVVIGSRVRSAAKGLDKTIIDEGTAGNWVPIESFSCNYELR